MSEIVYNPLSQVTSLKTGASTGNADVEQYSYDQQTGLLTNQKVIKQNTSQTLLDQTYEYQRGLSNGTVNGKTGQLTRIVNNLDHNKNRIYEFDALGRLKTARGGLGAGIGNPVANWTQSYGYDRYGNRTNVTASGMTANSQNVPTDGLPSQSYDQPSNRINTAGYEYDLAGNLVRGQAADGSWQRYVYDAAGRLNIIKDDAGNDKLGNGYTSSRQRLFTNETNVGLTWYVWGGSSVIAEYKSNTWGADPLVWKKSYIYAGNRLLSTFTNNGAGSETLEFQHPDRLGTKLITNNAANTSFEQSTLPFGTSLDAETTGTTNQRFTSYDRSTVAQLDYAVNRSYSSGQGRFTSPDPIGMGATNLGDPQSLNMYAYSGNEPINFTDPSGLNESMCSAEYSYGQCGGDGGFWGNSGYGAGGGGGGGFGDSVAYCNQTLGDLPPELQNSVDQHLQRISNSQAGNGFRTNAEVNVIYGGILAIVDVYETITARGFEWVFGKPDILWKGGEQDNQYRLMQQNPNGQGIGMLDPLDHMAMMGILGGLKGLLTGAVGGAAKTAAVKTGGQRALASGTASGTFARIGSLAGKRIVEVRSILQQNGFKFAGRTERGYIKFYGPGTKMTRAEIQIRPNGQVVRSSKGGLRYDSGGNIVTSHTGGEFIGGNFIGP